MYKRRIRRFVNSLRRTWKQKLCAIGMITIGALSAMLSEGDATMFIFMSVFAIPMFLSRKANWIA